MSFENYQSSEDRGQPVELFTFEVGSAAYRYCDSVADVTVGGETYVPLPITRSTIKSESGMDSNEVKIEVPKNSGIAQVFSELPPLGLVAVTIRQGHIPNADDPAGFLTGDLWPVVWVGRAIEGLREEDAMTISCDTAIAGLSRPGLKRNYQRTCPLVLYGAQCGASKAAAETETTATVVAGSRVTVDASLVAADYVGGLLEWETADGREVRTILGVSGSELRLSYAARGLVPTDPVFVYYGCARTMEVCGRLFSNIPNFGGQPDIPDENIVNKNIYT